MYVEFTKFSYFATKTLGNRPSDLKLLCCILDMEFLSGGKYQILVIKSLVQRVGNGRYITIKFQEGSQSLCSYPTLRCYLSKFSVPCGSIGVCPQWTKTNLYEYFSTLKVNRGETTFNGS